MKPFQRLTLLVATCAAILAAGSAFGQTCNLGTSFFFDKSGTCPGDGRELCNTGRMYLFNTWSYGGRQYLIGSTYSNAVFYDVTDPLDTTPPTFDPGAYQPWGQVEANNAPDDDQQQWDVSILDDTAYGIAMFQNYGWSTFQVTFSPTSGMPNGFTNVDRYRYPGIPISFIAASNPAHYARVFKGGDNGTYVVGSWLDRSTPSVRIAPFASGVVGTASPATVFTRVKPTDPLDTLKIGSTYWLFVYHLGTGGADATRVAAYDLSAVTSSSLSNPLFVLGAGTPIVTDPGIKDFYIDKTARRLYVLIPGAAGTVNVYNVANPGSATLLSTIALDAGKSYANVTASGDTVAVSQSNGSNPPWVQVFSIANPAAPFEVARGQLDPPAKSRQSLFDLWSDTGTTGDFALYEAGWSVGSLTRVSASCLSTDPFANFSVSGGAAVAACPATPTGASTGVADLGFPGDTFSITDASYGEITGKTLTITPAAGGAAVLTSNWSPLAGWSPPLTWATPTSQAPGEYWVTMTLSPAIGNTYVKTLSIFLCGNPAAALALTQGGAQNLVGDSINVSAAGTSGHPSAATPYTFYVTQGASSQQLTASGSTLASPYPLPAAGSYTFGVVAHYDFAGADAASCSGVPAQFLLGNYDSCASVVVTAANGVSLFEVWQNGAKVADSVAPGALLVDQPTTLKFTGKVAAAYTPNFVWNIPGGTPAVPSNLACTYTASPYTGTTCGPIPANTWTAGSPFAMNMGLQVCSGVAAGTVDCAGGTQVEPNIAAPTVTVTPSLYSFTFHVTPTNPNIGQSVSIVLDSVVAPAGGLTSLTFQLGAAKCGTTSTTQAYTCGGIFGSCVGGSTLSPSFTYGAAAGGQTLTITGSGAAGATTVPASNSAQVTVGTTGSCGPLPLTVNASPSTARTGVSIVFSITPNLSTAGDNVRFNFGDGSPPVTVNYPCPLGACSTTHSYTAQGTYTVSATATVGGAPRSGTTSVSITGGGGGNLTINPSKNPANVGDNIVFSFIPTLSRGGDAVTIQYGDGQQGAVSYPCPFGSCTVTHTYTAPNSFTVSASGTAGGAAVSGSLSLLVNNNCQAPAAPVANFTVAPNPANATKPVQFTDTSTNNPTSWSWSFGDAQPPFFGGGSSNQQNPVYTFSAQGTFTVTLSASNCRGSSQKQIQVVVGPSCTETVAPTADFSWGPQGALAGYPQQQQPYVGQVVTLTGSTAGSVSQWHWYDFQGAGIDFTRNVPTMTYTWTSSGDKNVRMTATNCVGTSTEVLKTVHVYDDIRPVTADFSWTPTTVATGTPVTFTAAQGPSYGDPDTFTWTFDDGSQQSGPQVTYTFRCGGNRRITLAATRSNYNNPNGPATTGKTVEVSGQTCGPESVMAVDAAKVQGLNDTNWHADVRIYNPSAFPTSITLQFLQVGKDNAHPFTVGPYQPAVAPKGTLVLNDILQWVKDTWGQDFSKTALRFTYSNEDNVAPVVMVRTYNLRPDGSRYGQINPGVNVIPGSTRTPQWLTGLHNNGTTDGFRTNYSIVNLQGEDGGVGGIAFTLFDESGTAQGTKTFGLAPYGYIQDSIKNLFGSGFENIGTFSIKIDVPQGKDIQVYASVMDNHTGDPVMITAAPSPDSPIYLPAMAHNPGEANTVWRTDLQITNPDSAGAHTWEIRYAPKSSDGLPVVARAVTLAADKSLSVDDLVEWAYSGLLPSDTATSGIVRIVPTDGSTVYPIVSARSYNLTPTGTFGQGIPPLWADKGITANSQNRRLVLTGLSSEDIARTNLGFVNLSETQGVNFVVYFYDETGTLLNPKNQDGTPKPYTFAIGPGTWDQDKLENRFRNAFKAALPSNLRAISAEIAVNDGGPGFVYASVIDSMTGDPNFIPAQPAP